MLYFCTSVYFKTLEKKTMHCIDPNKISAEIVSRSETAVERFAWNSKLARVKQVIF
jgi:hypothetical protein